MFNIYAKTKFAHLSNRWLSVGFFMVGVLLFSYSDADSIPTRPTSKSINKVKIESPYFLDVGTLQSWRSRQNFQEELTYVEKKDPMTAWFIFPIRNRMRDYYDVVAGIVATELHRRIDETAKVPPARFLIGRSEEGHYKLLGYAYQEIQYAMPVQLAKRRNEFNYYANHMIYNDHNIERTLLNWSYLGLSTTPSRDRLAVSDNDKLVRYDYYEAFQCRNLDIGERCFRTSECSINDYQCDMDYIKTSRKKLRAQYQLALQAVIVDIRDAVSLYLPEHEQKEVNDALEDIKTKKCLPLTDSEVAPSSRPLKEDL